MSKEQLYKQCLVDIEERLRVHSKPILDALRLRHAALVAEGKASEAAVLMRAYKWGVYGSCVHAQIALYESTEGEGG